jgi:formylglycine-generating enzyme required for sulfatase activity
VSSDMRTNRPLLGLVPQNVSGALLLVSTIAVLSGALMHISGGEAFAGAETQTMEAGQTFRDCSECPEMVVIPAGSFAMSSSAAETAHELASMQSDETEFNRRSLEWEHPQHSVSVARVIGVKVNLAAVCLRALYGGGGAATA